MNANAAADYFAGRIRCPGDLNNDGLIDDGAVSASSLALQRFFGLADLGREGPDGNGVSATTPTLWRLAGYDGLACPQPSARNWIIVLRQILLRWKPDEEIAVLS